MLSLGIDTSNYAASLAVFDTAAGEVVCDVKRLLPVRPGQLGLRQSEALFHHTSLLPALLQELAERLPTGTLQRVGAVGVSARPRPAEGSYMPCFLAGVSFAAAFGAAAGLRPVHTTHQQGHIAAALFAAGGAALFCAGTPVLVFHVSGGTTDLLLYTPDGDVRKLGGSQDLYAGQAVDRLGVRLGYAFPAGAQVSRTAALCSEPIRPKVSVHGMDCSLSGLENQCQALLAAGRNEAYVCRYCLLCIAETLRRMAGAALAAHPGLPVVFAGGVMGSTVIRDEITRTMPNVHFVPERFAGDNAIGVSILAAREVGAWPNTSV